MRTVRDDLQHCEIAIQFALNELMNGRTFYEDYFVGTKWEELSRTDKAICILQAYMSNQSLGDPKGFDKIRENMHKVFLAMRNKEIEEQEK